MMPGVRTGPLGLTINLIPRRFHQGHTPTRTFHLNLDKTRSRVLRVSARVSLSCRYVGERSTTDTVIPADIHSFAQKMLSFSCRIRHFESDALSG